MDLVLVMGTSLSGLNADRMASTPAARSHAGGCLGFVIINLQQTALDGHATLRLNARSDAVMGRLLEHCGLQPLPKALPAAHTLFAHMPSRVAVPYARDGTRLLDDALKLNVDTVASWMWLDLCDGATVKLTEGHNIQGARQPHMMHIGAPKPVKMRDGNTRAPAPGYGRVVRRDPASCSFVMTIEGVQMRLGIWWLEAAMRGGPSRLPVVNCEPAFSPPVAQK